MSATTPLPAPGDPPPGALPVVPVPSDALDDLAGALTRTPPTPSELGRWRWAVRQHLVGVRDLLAAEATDATDGWLAARSASTLRRRNALLSRISRLGPLVLESPDLTVVRRELGRLVVDVRHHRQRLHDLAYDAVELELGGED